MAVKKCNIALCGLSHVGKRTLLQTIHKIDPETLFCQDLEIPMLYLLAKRFPKLHLQISTLHGSFIPQQKHIRTLLQNAHIIVYMLETQVDCRDVQVQSIQLYQEVMAQYPHLAAIPQIWIHNKIDIDADQAPVQAIVPESQHHKIIQACIRDGRGVHTIWGTLIKTAIQTTNNPRIDTNNPRIDTNESTNWHE